MHSDCTHKPSTSEAYNNDILLTEGRTVALFLLQSVCVCVCPSVSVCVSLSPALGVYGVDDGAAQRV